MEEDEIMDMDTDALVTHVIVKLPVHLHSLELCGQPWSTLLAIVNVDQLHDLEHVAVRISSWSRGIAQRDLLPVPGYVCTIQQLQNFVSQLPADLRSLSLYVKGSIYKARGSGSGMDGYSACSLDELSFKHFTNLERLIVR
ncbi:unnamed protein product [Ambrosiozyma monospora]|uniref:Unnamed protein product n=1 Tax=Ambrosiozyma monospora TaxID=43982 RepID=A0ACB5U701_AMBMO|nr:unnamed protein product [Ambrosiozyma monospora]